MNVHRVLIIPGPAEPQANHLLAAVHAAGLESELTAANAVIKRVRDLDAAGAVPPAILLAADNANPLALARELRAVWPAGHLIFIGAEADTDALRRALARTPMIGVHWSLAAPDDPALAKIVADAVHGTGRRLKLRTTLDRVNARLAAPKPVDGIEYRRALLSERYLESFLAQIGDAIVALDDRANVLYCNASAARLFNVAAPSLQGVAAAHLPGWLPGMQDCLDRIHAGQRSASGEFELASGAGVTPVDIVLSAVADEAGKFIGTTLTLRDISARRRQAEAERQAQAQRNAAIERERLRIVGLFDQAPGFMAITRGPDHVFELVNQAYCRLLGRRPPLGEPVTRALPDLAGQGFLELLDQVYASGVPYVGQAVPLAVRRQAGGIEELYIDFVYQPVFDEDGRIGGIFCQGVDVTAHKHAQDALLAHQAQLEYLVSVRTESLRQAELALHQSQKLEAIGKLTGGIAHDFNNLLQVIGGNLEMLQADSHDPVGRGRISKAIVSVERGAKLASQLLSFARRQPLQPVATNLGNILRDLDDMLRRALGEAIRLETVVGGGLWITLVDRNQLENVVLNLAINARDAMQGAGRLTLEVGNAMLDDSYVADQADVVAGQYVLLAITDTGSGMSPATMAQAFEPFFTTKPEGEGTGLGLSMVYGFVKQSGGHIRIYSEVGQGTTFKIYLPRVHLPEALIEDVRTRPAIGGDETVLVVEDDLALQATVVEMLTGLGYRVLKANDGDSALTVLRSGAHIDLLFTDVVMPGLVRSPELARQAVAIVPDIAVLFTSGYTQNAIVHDGRLDAGVELISKPYRRDDLARKIRHVLANQRQVNGMRAQRAVPTAPAAAFAARRILVVEDNADAAEMLCELLAALGHTVHSAASGEAALQVLAETEVDILLTDVGLPGMSGVDLARRAHADRPALRVIFSSGYGQIEDIGVKALMLPKPYDLTRLRQVLADAG